MRRLVAPLLLVLFALSIAGCGPAGAAWIVALVALALVVAGCSESHTLRPDGEVPSDAGRDAGPDPGGDAAADAGGFWESCCEDGRLATCFCPAGWACNYGMGLVACDDGTCGYAIGGSPWDPAERARICGETLDAGADAGEDAGVDAGGAWEPCCDDATGTITTCFCPAGVECNYGWFRTCLDGSCRTGSACPEDDAGVSGGAG